MEKGPQKQPPQSLAPRSEKAPLENIENVWWEKIQGPDFEDFEKCATSERSPP